MALIQDEGWTCAKVVEKQVWSMVYTELVFSETMTSHEYDKQQIEPTPSTPNGKTDRNKNHAMCN